MGHDTLSKLIQGLDDATFEDVQNELQFAYLYHSVGFQRAIGCYNHKTTDIQDMNHQLIRYSEIFDPTFPKVKDRDGYDKKFRAVDIGKLLTATTQALQYPDAFGCDVQVAHEYISSAEQGMMHHKLERQLYMAAMGQHADNKQRVFSSPLYKAAQEDILRRYEIEFTESNKEALMNNYIGFFVDSQEERNNKIEDVLRAFFENKYMLGNEDRIEEAQDALFGLEQQLVDLQFKGLFLEMPNGLVPSHDTLEVRFHEHYTHD